MYLRLYMIDKSDNYIKYSPVINTINHGEERMKRYTEKKAPDISAGAFISYSHLKRHIKNDISYFCFRYFLYQIIPAVSKGCTVCI
ncbi:hypothetical protein AYY17_16405 [Morganella psychrotolerans]|uniref:Uncharacterized protein n=1 Tax=Morganella psychrotolerans TaxID=368603 RepID=A0A1B8HM20_9GAMM|nr:hypothetical protein AYY17_16405 [Morganella psychrotolerans]